MFEQASRMKLRFDSNKGGSGLTVEQLWDIPLLNERGESLDNIAQGLNRALEQSKEKSFVVKKSKANSIIKLKLNIVERIIKVKLDEIEKRENEVMLKAEKFELDELIAEKEKEAMKELSLKDLKKMRKEL